MFFLFPPRESQGLWLSLLRAMYSPASLHRFYLPAFPLFFRPPPDCACRGFPHEIRSLSSLFLPVSFPPFTDLSPVVVPFLPMPLLVGHFFHPSHSAFSPPQLLLSIFFLSLDFVCASPLRFFLFPLSLFPSCFFLFSLVRITYHLYQIYVGLSHQSLPLTVLTRPYRSSPHFYQTFRSLALFFLPHLSLASAARPFSPRQQTDYRPPLGGTLCCISFL